MKMYNNPYFNSVAQPYYPNYNFNNYQQQQQNNNTNMIFVNGIEDVRARWQPVNSTWLYADNDKAIVYKKTVDNKGQFEIEPFDLVKHEEKPQEKQNTIDTSILSGYVKSTDMEAISNEIKSLREQIDKLSKTPSVQGSKESKNPKSSSSQGSESNI